MNINFYTLNTFAEKYRNQKWKQIQWVYQNNTMSHVIIKPIKQSIQLINIYKFRLTGQPNWIKI